MPIERAIKQSVRRLRRTLRAARGRDLRLRLDVRLPTLPLGTDYGGWTISPLHTPRGCTVFSVGIGTDISFDLAMIDRFNARVFGFDPTPKSVAWIARQRLPDRFRFVAVGLAEFDGEQTFRLPRADFDSYSPTLPGSAGPADEVRCPVRRLATLAADAGCDAIDLLKLDIEGGEYAAVPDVLASGLPIGQLLLELHYDASPGQIGRAAALVERVRAAGFRLFARSAVGKELSFVHQSLLDEQKERRGGT